MKWVDHKRLVYAAASAQEERIPFFVFNGLEEGVVYPDKNPDRAWRVGRGWIPYQVTEPHHAPDKNRNKIMRFIWQARGYYLIGDEYKAGFQLGQALHYIHDGFVGKGTFGWSHDSNEEEIKNTMINNSTLYSGARDSRCDPVFVENLVHDISPQNPKEALDRAAYTTSAIFRAVFNNQPLPLELKEEYRRAGIEHTRYLKAGICADIVILLAGILMQAMFITGFALFAGYVIFQASDQKYNQIEKKRKWFFKE